MKNEIKELSFENHPLHVLAHEGKVAFLTKEVARILDISKARQSLRQSKVLEEGIDYATIPTISLEQGNNLLPCNVNHVSILYLSGFFLFVLRSNKPVAVPFTRWAIREAIPQAFQQRQLPELSEDMLYKMIIQERQGSLYARQILNSHGYLPADGDKRLTVEGGQS